MRSGKTALAVHGYLNGMVDSGQTEQDKTDEQQNILIIFFHIKGIVHKEFVSAAQTVNSSYYSDVLR
jgi:ligand-binding sensor protein